MKTGNHSSKIAVVIPCYKVKKHILKVIKEIDSIVDLIIIVDDKCPEESGKYVEQKCSDFRIQVVYNETNKGVGSATITGYKTALKANADIIVKIDGDGQMDTSNIPKLIQPILLKEADYTKGNRFYFLTELKTMPNLRLIGNSILSMINKIVSGYWSITDPTNGFTAISKEILQLIPLEKIDSRYFFESDMLFRLSTSRAVIQDIPMHARYGDEISSLSIWKVIFSFPLKYLKRFLKRLFYLYFLRDFNVGTLHLIFGSVFFIFGIIFGSVVWVNSIVEKSFASTGTVMLSVLPIILGFQMLLSFLSYDMQNQPQIPIRKINS